MVLVSVLVSFTAACGAHTRAERSGASTLTVAAAANLTQVFQELGPRFEAQTGIHPVFSFASTAQLTQQIENAAPFDIFVAADAQHVDALERKGLLFPGSEAVYAAGVLVLWIPPQSKARIERLDNLASSPVRTIAIANPKLAPYGEAAVETLKHLGIWDKVEPKIVYAENISMAREYGKSGNADAVFTAYSLVLKDEGRIIQIPETLHEPIVQELGILAHANNINAARQFASYLITGQGQTILAKSGYRAPGELTRSAQ